MPAFALQQVKTKYHSGIAQAQGYLPHVVLFGQWKHWIQITSRLYSLKGSNDCAFACVCVEFRFYLGHPYRLRLCLQYCSRRSWKPSIKYSKVLTEGSANRDCFGNFSAIGKYQPRYCSPPRFDQPSAKTPEDPHFTELVQWNTVEPRFRPPSLVTTAPHAATSFPEHQTFPCQITILGSGCLILELKVWNSPLFLSSRNRPLDGWWSEKWIIGCCNIIVFLASSRNGNFSMNRIFLPYRLLHKQIIASALAHGLSLGSYHSSNKEKPWTISSWS